jgi:lipoprotein NlpD
MKPLEVSRLRRIRATSWLLSLGIALLVTACASPQNRAPIEDRRPSVKGSSATAGSEAAREAQPAASAVPEVAPKPGFYVVKPGDTLVRIGLDTGQNWKDVVRWNGLENPNLIEVGQVLRVYPPGSDPPIAGARPVVTAKTETKALETRSAPSNAAASGAPSTSSANASPASAAAAASPAAPPATGPSNATAAVSGGSAPAPVPAPQGDDAINWGWPAAGPVTTSFDENKSKGLAIAGKAGDAVLAAADGRVVYAGSGLRGYGNLVIVKHNATFLTAYAHNQILLVKEDQAVRRGQRIAEMGSTDADRVQLHFEIRRQGKPVDPAKLLPAR